MSRIAALVWIVLAGCAGSAEPATAPTAESSGTGEPPGGESTPISCAADEVACTIDCEGTSRCMPAHACPEVACAVCPAGTCRRSADGPCATPTGPLGNACCACGEDGMCSSHCRCAALDTPIATEDGERPIRELRVGDLVVSVDHGRRTLVPIARVARSAAIGHHVVRVELATGATLRMSPGHPLADGRSFADLASGDRIDGVLVVSAALEPYDLEETADILPASDTGTYVAAGVLVGSTLAPAPPSDPVVTAR